MNLLFSPTYNESQIINEILELEALEYSLIRMTKTMLEKSIIDASQIFRDVLETTGVLSYDNIGQGQKIINKTLLLSDQGWKEEKCSFYRPNTKNGDPRFWVYNLKQYTSEGNLIFFAAKDDLLITIPLISIDTIRSYGSLFLKKEQNSSLNRLVEKMRVLKNLEWIESVGGSKPADKDVGDTLEKALNIPVNSLKTPDFLGEIEIKSKRAKSKTRNNLFAQKPDWGLSKYNSAKDYLINYGITSDKHPGFKTLYVTIKASSPNPQGFYLELDYNSGHLKQMIDSNNLNEMLCIWEFSKLKNRLYEKHPKTLWVIADERIMNGKTYFKYEKLTLTEKPIFSSFLSLVSSSEITLDWTHRCLPDGKKYNDHGFLFKIPTKSRKKLFTTSQDIVL